MSKRTKHLSIGIGMAALLMMAFQNCADSRFSPTNGVMFQSVDPGALGGLDDPRPPMDPDREPQSDHGDCKDGKKNPEGVPVSELPSKDRTLENGEVACSMKEMMESIVYGQNLSSNAQAQSFKSLSSNSISAEWISQVGSMAKTELKVTAHTIDKISSMAVQSLKVNARLVKHAGSMAFSKTRIITDEIVEMSSFSGRACVAASKVGRIGSNAGALTIVGRTVNGRRAIVESVGQMGGFLSLYNVDVDEVANLATKAKLEGVNLKSLSKGAGTVILVDSKIDSVSNFAGTIILRGNSSVGSISPQNAVKVVREK